MTDYQKQGKSFLNSTGSKLVIKFKKYDKHFPSDTDKRNVWEVKLSRGSREFVFPFGDSIANRDKMLKKCFNKNRLFANICT